MRTHTAVVAAILAVAGPADFAAAQSAGTGAVQMDLSVTEQATNVLVYNGGATVCDANDRNCVPANSECNAVVASPNGVASVNTNPAFVTALFPYATTGDLRQSDFQVDNGGCRFDPFATRGISASPD